MRLKFLALTLLLTLLHATAIAAQTTAPAEQAPLDSESFWQALMTGNKQYVAGKVIYDDLVRDRGVVAGGQQPPTTVLSCSDSRVPPEIAFNQTVGGVFVVRAAGNVADTFGIASIEYAIAQGWTKLLVVLAHQDCGAVKASMGQGDPGTPHLLALAQRIRSSFYGVQWDPNNKEAVKKATIANARASAASLLAQSPLIRQAVTSGAVKVVVAYYSLETGEVTRVD